MQLVRSSSRAPERLGRVDQRPPAQVVAAERAGVAHDEPRLLEDLPAEGRPLVDERDREAERGGLGGSREPGRPAADDEQVVRLGWLIVERAGRRRAPPPGHRPSPSSAGIGGSAAPSVCW